MSDVLRAIEADFETLAKHLALMIDLHEDDRASRPGLAHLRQAWKRATEGAALVREYRDKCS